METGITKTNEVSPITDKELIGYLDTMGLTKSLTVNEKNAFLQISKAFQLNPFKREIYCTKYGENASIIVGYEVYIKRAERTGTLDGWEVLTEGSVEAKNLKAIITIHRKDRSKPFRHEVHYSEYVQNKKDGTPNKFWKEKPITMIKKVAMAQGFRLFFSDELGGMPYTHEEMNVEEGAAVVVEETPKQIKEVEVVDISKLLVLVDECQTIEQLTAIWKGNTGLQLNQIFIDAVSNKKSSLK